MHGNLCGADQKLLQLLEWSPEQQSVPVLTRSDS